MPGIVISGYARIGRNLFIRQNSTIGIKTLGLERYQLEIGDNVSIGANSCIIGDTLSIGDNVTIGAMSLVNKSVPANSIYYTQRSGVLVEMSFRRQIIDLNASMLIFGMTSWGILELAERL